jgi:hypothetical protein
MDITEIICDRMNWIYLPEDRGQWRVLVRIILKLQVP